MGKDTGSNRKSGRAGGGGGGAGAGDGGGDEAQAQALTVGGLWQDQNGAWRQSANGVVVTGFKGQKVSTRSDISVAKYGKFGMNVTATTAAQANNVSLNAGASQLASGNSTAMRVVKTPAGSMYSHRLVKSSDGSIIASARSRSNLLSFAGDMGFSVYE